MKILHIITQGTWGGAQRYVFDIVSSPTQDIEHILAVGSPTEQQHLQQKHTSIQLQHLVRHISPIQDVAAITEVMALYKKIQPTIVHLNSTKAGLIGSIAAKFTPKSYRPYVIYTVHGWVFTEALSFWKKFIYKQIEKQTAAYKNRMITTSPQETQIAIHELDISPNAITEIPIGIDPIPFYTKEQAKKELPISQTQNKVLIGCIANAYKTKGLETLINAVAESAIIQTQADIIIIGDGPETQRLNKMIDQKKLKNIVSMLGKKDDAARYIQAFDIMVLPSHKEGLPYALIEIMQSQVPLIATRVGGIPSVIEHKKEGILCEAQDTKSLQKSIEYALGHRANMHTYAKQAYTKSKKYTKQQMLQNTYDLYRNTKT